jgi:hypothetical protein
MLKKVLQDFFHWKILASRQPLLSARDLYLNNSIKYKSKIPGNFSEPSKSLPPDS